MEIERPDQTRLLKIQFHHHSEPLAPSSGKAYKSRKRRVGSNMLHYPTSYLVRTFFFVSSLNKWSY